MCLVTNFFKGISAVAARKLQTVDFSSESLVQEEIPIDPQSDDHFSSGGLMPALSITTSSQQRGLGSPNFEDDTKTNDGNTSDDPYYVEDYGFNGVITTYSYILLRIYGFRS